MRKESPLEPGFARVGDPPSIPLPDSALQKTDNHATYIYAGYPVEYAWPVGSQNTYMVEKEVIQFLGVTNFKERYPNLHRHNIVAEEYEYLLSNLRCGTKTFDEELMALKTVEVLKLMSGDFPEKFTEYFQLTRGEEEVISMENLNAEKGKLDKFAEQRKCLVKKAAVQNMELNQDRMTKRRKFFDIQTMILQEPVRRMSPKRDVLVNAYPVRVMHSQKTIVPPQVAREWVDRMPYMKGPTVIMEIGRSSSPETITVTSNEISAEAVADKASAMSDRNKANSNLTRKSEGKLLNRGELTGESCAFCGNDLHTKDQYVQCSKCGSCGHISCMDMSLEMYAITRQYDWMCMECKPCSVCSNLDDEDQMLFCDRCDRGYHTYCVGLSKPPSGRWQCQKFCSVEENKQQDFRAYVQGAASTSYDSIKVKDEPLRCADCNVVMSKNELHKWKRRTLKTEVLCSQCNRRRRYEFGLRREVLICCIVVTLH
ncbi:PHD finger protein 10 [Trichinella nelsoni]|uniref:PHD finger protein 10 n=1 Tax=Trichinella nelsoni TaxID=6336 RepID=A0A0V0S643_9BILA|nr:PHD finger protein 10 [Trichinella nelsoni]KRX22105.1 PHD finger protein 10 [Trichinella nelsoni]